MRVENEQEHKRRKISSYTPLSFCFLCFSLIVGEHVAIFLRLDDYLRPLVSSNISSGFSLFESSKIIVLDFLQSFAYPLEGDLNFN